MALVIPVGYGNAIVSLRWSGDPEPMAVTFGFSGPGIANEDDVIIGAGALFNAFGDNIMPLLADDIELTAVEVTYQLEALPEPPVVGAAVGSVVGSQDGDLLPQNSAYLVHKRTNHGGRGGRGRFYLPGVEDANVDDLGNVAGAFITAANTAFNAFLDEVSADALLGAVMLLHDSEGAYAATIPYAVQSLTMDPVIATQRRRLRR